MPLLKEVLRSLIPSALHPRLDGRKPKGKAGALAASTSLHLRCGAFQMKRFDEHALYEGKALSKGLIEFFVRVLRSDADVLAIQPSVYIGHVGLAERLGCSDDGQEFLQIIRTWKSLSGESMFTAKQSQTMLLPVATCLSLSVFIFLGVLSMCFVRYVMCRALTCE